MRIGAGKGTGEGRGAHAFTSQLNAIQNMMHFKDIFCQCNVK